MKQIKQWAVLIMLTAITAMATQAQTVDMSNYIVFTTQPGKTVSAEVIGQGWIKITNGSGNDRTIKLPSGHTKIASDAPNGTVTVYGKLDIVNCRETDLTGIDVTHNKSLRELVCNNNELTQLDVSNMPELYLVYCWDNKIHSLNAANSPKLEIIWAHNNYFTAQQIDDAICSLYDRRALGNVGRGSITFHYSESTTPPALLNINQDNARRKNWRLGYGVTSGGHPVDGTTGTYRCPGDDPPTPGCSGKITFNEIKDKEFRVSFCKATSNKTPQDRLKYELTCIEVNGTYGISTDFVNYENIIPSDRNGHLISGLKKGAKYRVSVSVKDEADNVSDYVTAEVTTGSDTQKPTAPVITSGGRPLHDSRFSSMHLQPAQAGLQADRGRPAAAHARRCRPGGRARQLCQLGRTGLHPRPGAGRTAHRLSAGGGGARL